MRADGEKQTRRLRPSALRSALAGPQAAALIIALLLVGGGTLVLVHSQSRAAAGLQAEFGRRAALAAHLTAAALASNGGQYADVFDGRVEAARSQLRAFESTQPDHRAVLVDTRGRAIAAWPASGPTRARALSLARAPVAGKALRTRGTVLSNLAFWGPRRTPVVTMGSSFGTPRGRFVFVATIDAEVLATFASAYLSSAPAVPGAKAYLIDGRSRVIASSAGLRQGVRLPVPGLAAALRSDPAGALGADRYTSAAMPNAPWRVVFVAPRTALLAPVLGGTRRASWGLLAAFTLALVGLLGAGATALRRSSQVAELRERERAANALAHERLHDALTGLPNRALFLDRTERALAAAAAGGHSLAVLRAGLDRFTRINESLGHAAGDELLARVARRLRRVLPPEFTLSRFAGDGFLVLVDDPDAAADAVGIAATVQASVAKPLHVAGRTVHLSCSVGVARQAPDVPAVTADALVRDADAAMHRVKAECGPGQVRIGDTALHAAALDLLDTEAALRHGIQAGELSVHYQPIVTLPGGGLRGVEALVRWQRPGVGLVPPLRFIGIAEECGLIGEIGRFVLRTAAADTARWGAEGLLPPGFVLSVNVSAHQLDEGALPDLVADVLRTWTLPPQSLWLEITETAVARDPEAAHDTLTALRAMGVRVALDDFGTGHTSLEHLARSLPVDILKLDRTFVSHMDDARDRAVVAAVPPMALGLDMLVVAEGAETAEQAEALAALGYTHVQGYHFGRPMPAARLAERLAEAGAPMDEAASGSGGTEVVAGT